jgi:FkbM family methyltransferase
VTQATIIPLDYPTEPKLQIWAHNQHEFGMRKVPAQKEPWTFEFLKAMPPGSVLADLGANVGGYALFAAALGHSVIACEPGYENYASLVRNSILNRVNERLLALNVAVGDSNRLDWLHYTDLQSGAASHVLGQATPGNVPLKWHRQMVPVWRLDDLVPALNLPLPTHVKLDVDGSELAALVGMERLLTTSVVGLMMEMRLDQEEAMLAWLAERGYKRVGRFDQRGGRTIGNVVYSSLVREVAP